MADARASGVSSIADFSTVVAFGRHSIVADSRREVQTITSTVRLTFHLASGTVDQVSVMVRELAKDKDSPPFKTCTEYVLTPPDAFPADRSSPFIFSSVIEDEIAQTSNLLPALAAACLKKAKKTIADRERIQ